MLYYAMLSYAVLCYAMLCCYALLFYVMLCYATPYPAMLLCFMLCCAMLCPNNFEIFKYCCSWLLLHKIFDLRICKPIPTNTMTTNTTMNQCVSINCYVSVCRTILWTSFWRLHAVRHVKEPGTTTWLQLHTALGLTYTNIILNIIIMY